MVRTISNGDRMSALDEALRRMVQSCPVPRRVRAAADLLAGHATPERAGALNGAHR